MESIVVALWTCPTSHSEIHCQKSLAVKIAEMDKALKKSHKRLLDNMGEISKTNPFQVIFAAPEYYFTEPGKIRIAMDETTKTRLEHAILALSRKYPTTLIVPGTVYYWKPMLKPSGALKLDRKNAQFVQTTATKDRRDKALSRLSDAMLRDVKDEWHRLAISEEGLATSSYHGTRGPTGLPLPSMLKKMDSLMERTSFIVRNATYLYLAGTRHGKYDKQSDYHESLCAPDDMVFVPGTRDECPVIGKYKFGVEICADHALGRLKKRSPTGLHFHIVASDSVVNNENHMAMDKEGFFLHASSDPNQNHVYYKGKLGAIACLLGNEYLGEANCGDGTVHFWLLPLPPTPGKQAQ
jgi:hypothetical protein